MKKVLLAVAGHHVCRAVNAGSWIAPLFKKASGYLYQAMHQRSYYIVNAITLYRLFAAPFLVFLVLTHRVELFKWMLAISFLTDAVDGYLARRYRVTSILGSKLDSIADDLTVGVAILGIIILKPGFIRHEMAFIILLAALYLLQTGFAFIRYGKMTSFHTYAAKLAAITQGIFLILLFFLPEPVYVLFYIMAIVTAIDLAEEIILVLLLPQWQSDVKGLYWVLKRKDHTTE